VSILESEPGYSSMTPAAHRDDLKDIVAMLLATSAMQTLSACHVRGTRKNAEETVGYVIESLPPKYHEVAWDAWITRSEGLI
jgi:hypothetical protein